MTSLVKIGRGVPEAVCAALGLTASTVRALTITLDAEDVSVARVEIILTEAALLSVSKAIAEGIAPGPE